MRTVEIVQARMGSTRLPGKVLMDICGKPVLARVLDRVRDIPGVDGVVVATTGTPRDAGIVDLAESAGVAVWRGAEDDVLDRYHQAAVAYAADVILRITADCPLLDPRVSGVVLERFSRGDLDYASNVHPPTFPDGMDTEVLSFGALDRAWRGAMLEFEREHVTPYIWRRPGEFKLANVAGPVDLSAHRWTLDVPEDLDFIRDVYSRFAYDARPGFGMFEILGLFDTESPALPWR